MSCNLKQQKEPELELFYIPPSPTTTLHHLNARRHGFIIRIYVLQFISCSLSFFLQTACTYNCMTNEKPKVRALNLFANKQKQKFLNFYANKTEQSFCIESGFLTKQYVQVILCCLFSVTGSRFVFQSVCVFVLFFVFCLFFVCQQHQVTRRNFIYCMFLFFVTNTSFLLANNTNAKYVYIDVETRRNLKGFIQNRNNEVLENGASQTDRERMLNVLDYNENKDSLVFFSFANLFLQQFELIVTGVYHGKK